MTVKEIIYTSKREVSCLGSQPPYDHPLVYLNIKEGQEEVICPYCSKKFLYAKKSNKEL